MKVQSIINNKGKAIPNQVTINDCFIEIDFITGTATLQGNMFVSYNTNIAFITVTGDVFLDEKWDYSKTTGKYRNRFLNETKKDTERRIKDGVYLVVI